MRRPIDQHTALIFTMVLVSAAEGEMTDAELDMIGRQVRYLPVFRDFDHQRLTEVGRDCADLLRHDDGLDVAIEMIAEALPQPLRETAYALACDVAAADGTLESAELEDRAPVPAHDRRASARRPRHRLELTSRDDSRRHGRTAPSRDKYAGGKSGEREDDEPRQDQARSRHVQHPLCHTHAPP